MKTIHLIGAAMIGAELKFPAQGPFEVDDDEAERLIASGLTRDVAVDVVPAAPLPANDGQLPASE